MTFEEYQHKIREQREIELQQEHLEELLKVYLIVSQIEEIYFFNYDYKLNSFVYGYTINKNGKFVSGTNYEPFDDFEYTLISEIDEITYGMIAFNTKPETSKVSANIFDKITETLKKIFDLEKDIAANDKKLDIFIVSDSETMHFARKLEKNLDIILNADITLNSSILPSLPKLQQKNTKSIIIYTIADEKLLKQDDQYLNTNDFLIVIGPDDFDLLLYCGRLDVYQYLSINEFVGEQIRRIIKNTKYEIQNKYENKNNIIGIAGIAGGVGTTTIAMNSADLIAKNCPNENILFIDLSKSKAISNLFLSQNPTPKKTIIDLINSSKYDIEDNLENGLEKIRENFYMINGIQKHIDSDYLEQSIFIEKLLEYIGKMSEKFNYVIIDVGTANAFKLNTTIYDIVNELWIVSDMSLPHISKLKTFFSLMKRAGLKEKLTFVMNRYDDTINSLSVADVEDILNTTVDDKVNFEYRIPHDYRTMGHCWNFCELATNFDEKSKFTKQLNKMLEEKNYYTNEDIANNDNKSLFDMFKK